MKINLIAVGRKLPAWINSGYEEYAKRLTGECDLKLLEIAAVKRSNSVSPAKIKSIEAERIRKQIPAGSYVIALDENGKSCTTRALSEKFSGWLADGRNVTFIIGGADGLDDSLIEQSDEVLSLSELTLPHGLARILVAEQLYRAFSILKNHPYHRE
ncbi:MAG: 23S rRNA (pseudouridine(1915)-N(3))-methyltransferase RlmH [Gammaproteobacteria bacterium]|nr:23S rRNA (pseudouridine(1915)-N(3))-methyltransferase RlmH [Gammaproteobacteria bacterium]